MNKEREDIGKKRIIHFFKVKLSSKMSGMHWIKCEYKVFETYKVCCLGKILSEFLLMMIILLWRREEVSVEIIMAF